MEEAFHNLKVSLCKLCIFNVPLPADVFELHTDASGVGISGVLNIVHVGESLPVAFYSCQLRGAERRYSATELEALAVVETVRHFNHFLYGCSFVVFTDHHLLTSLMSSKVLNRYLHGISIKLMEHDFYCRGEDNANADGLSRQAWLPEEIGYVEDPMVDAANSPVTFPVVEGSSSLSVVDLCSGDCGDTPRREGRRCQQLSYHELCYV